MPDFLDNRTDVEFHGYDITQTNIDKHKAKFKNKPWTFKVRYELWKLEKNNYFKQHDIVADSIPRSFDLILSRHTMMHLYFVDVMQALNNFKNSGSK